MTRRLRADEARRMILRSQGFADPRPSGAIDVRHLRRVLRRIGLVQIDSVDVLARAHYVPLFSRLGPYPVQLLDDTAYRRRELFEQWVHEASLVPAELHPLLRHRMAEGRRSQRMTALASERPEFVDAVLDEVARRGPLTARDLSDPGTATGPWWGWAPGKVALELLFARGRVAVADRVGFVRRYDLSERVLPAEVLAAPTPPREDAVAGLVARAASHLGVATIDDLTDYHRLRGPEVRRAVTRLVADGTLHDAEVHGWDRPAFVHRDAVVARRVTGARVVSPFDPLVFHRPRMARAFGMDYRIEIYVPASRRRWGYYVLPVLVDDALVARVDLAADRRRRRLRVLGAWWEASRDGPVPAARVAAAIREMGVWRDLDDVEVDAAAAGDAAADLRRALRAAAGA